MWQAVVQRWWWNECLSHYHGTMLQVTSGGYSEWQISLCSLSHCHDCHCHANIDCHMSCHICNFIMTATTTIVIRRMTVNYSLAHTSSRYRDNIWKWSIFVLFNLYFGQINVLFNSSWTKKWFIANLNSMACKSVQYKGKQCFCL